VLDGERRFFDKPLYVNAGVTLNQERPYQLFDSTASRLLIDTSKKPPT
jgi:hypothetical protein